MGVQPSPSSPPFPPSAPLLPTAHMSLMGWAGLSVCLPWSSPWELSDRSEGQGHSLSSHAEVWPDPESPGLLGPGGKWPAEGGCPWLSGGRQSGHGSPPALPGCRPMAHSGHPRGCLPLTVFKCLCQRQTRIPFPGVLQGTFTASEASASGCSTWNHLPGSLGQGAGRQVPL